MGCDDWPEVSSLLELKALLRTGIYVNIGIDCDVAHSQRVCLQHFLHSIVSLILTKSTLLHCTLF